MFGRALVADADIGIAAADIDLVVGGDQFEPEAVFDAPELADVAGQKRRGPGAGGDPDDSLTDGAILPALERQHGGFDVLGASEEIFAGLGKAIAGLAAMEQRLPHLPLERGDAPAQGGRAEAGGAGRGTQAAEPRHVEKEPEVIPTEVHFSVLQCSLRSCL